MSALKKVMEEARRKREALDEKVLKGRKYIKRSELERIETSQTEEDSGHPLASGGTTPTSKKSGGLVLLSPTSMAPVADSPIFSIPKSEVVRRLRERDEPIRMFGETDKAACMRLRQIEILAPEINKGGRNDFKDALDRIDADYLIQVAKQEQGADGASNLDLKVREDGTTIEFLQEKFGELKAGDEDDVKRQDLCHKTFRFLMNEWAKDLNSQSLEEKRSYQNKVDLATHSQTESYISPLLRQLKTKKTSLDILVFMARICGHLVNREYVQANDAYLSMSIGNAPWPIGVTMVGIHARTGREKIFSQQIAHVLNDETQRKYIQGVKRMMTFCQRKFCTDPSKCVEYNAIQR